MNGSPPKRLRRLPPRGQHQEPGKAGSVAFPEGVS